MNNNIMYQAAKLPLWSAEMESRIWLWKDGYKGLVLLQQGIPLTILLTLE